MKEPSDVAIYAARIMRAYPSLSAYSAAMLATELAAIERAQEWHALRACNGDYRKHVAGKMEHDPDAEAMAGKRIEKRLAVWHRALGLLLISSRGEDSKRATRTPEWWAASATVILAGDPRGRCLTAQFPGEAPQP